jgi:hypothetical protein
MARPRLGEGKTERVHLVITDAEVAAIESWRYKNKVPSKSEAIRRLCQIGISYDREGKTLLKRSARALKAILLMLDKISKADVDKMPKGIRGGLSVVVEEQLAANKAALSGFVAASTFAGGADTSEMDVLIKRAEEAVKVLVNREAKK